MTQSQDSLSVVLPVHNDAANLTRRVGELLEFLPELTVPFEIVIVDNGSTDRTDETAHELALQYPQLRVCRHPKRQTNEELASQSLNETVSDFVITVAENGAVSTVRLKQLWTVEKLRVLIVKPRSPTRPSPTASKTGLSSCRSRKHPLQKRRSCA
jgi:glycosyltransferase involved in cell wall biosynthesis